MIQNNLRTPQLAGFARQLGCKKSLCVKVSFSQTNIQLTTPTHTHYDINIGTFKYSPSPLLAGIGPIKHPVDGGDALFTQWDNIAPGHYSIVHTRVAG